MPMSVSTLKLQRRQPARCYARQSPEERLSQPALPLAVDDRTAELQDHAESALGRRLSWLLIAACLVALAGFAARGAHSRYLADDFATANRLAASGFWGSQLEHRHDWSGRYSFFFAIAVVQSFGPGTAAVTPLLGVVCALLVALRFRAPAVGIAVAYATIDGATDVYQSLLWQTGMLSYLAPLILIGAWLVSLSRRRDGRPTWCDLVIPFVAGGFSETAAICQVVFFTLGCVFAPRERRGPLAVALLSSLLSLAAMASAPGNAVRHASAPPGSMATVVGAVVEDWSRYAGGVIARAAPAAALVFFAAALFAPRPADVRRRLWLALLVIAGTLGAVYLASMTAVRLPAPGRALIVPYFYILVAVALLGSSVGATFSSRGRRLASAALVILLAAGPGLALARNAAELPADRDLARAWDAVDAAARAHRGGDLLVVAPEAPHGLGYLSRDPNAFWNRQVREFYGLRSIAVR
jgi:hypothetical protein